MEKTCSVLLLFNFLRFVYNPYIIFRSCDVLTRMNRRDILSRHFYSKRVINIEDIPFSKSYKIQQCISKNTNVWIEFIPSIMTCGKEFLRYSVLQGNTKIFLRYSVLQGNTKEFLRYSVLQGNTRKMLSIFENFLFVEVSYEYVMVARLKNGCSVLIHLLCNKHSSPNSWYNLSRQEPLMAPVIANSALYCSDSILFENDALDGWS